MPFSCSTSYFYIKSLLSFLHTCSHRSSWPAPTMAPEVCRDPSADLIRALSKLYVGYLGGKKVARSTC